MSNIDVRIVRLEPMRVACFRAIGETPEDDAWEKLRRWASPGRLLDEPDAHPVFGFNNPGPSPDRKEYGYELWIRIDSDALSEGGIEVKDFAGGLYAVTRCQLIGDPEGSVPEVWKKLWDWVKAGHTYKWRKTHELEHARNPQAADLELVLDLYLPIAGRSESD